jgi:hypothetical protein
VRPFSKFPTFFFLTCLTSISPFFSCLIPLRSAPAGPQRINGVSMSPLSSKFNLKVPTVSLTFAQSQKTVGHALKELLPNVFTVENLKEGGVKKLELEKVAALVGERLGLTFAVDCSLLTCLSVAFCKKNEFPRLFHRKKQLSMLGSVRKYLSQKCSDARKGKSKFANFS